MSAFVLGLSPAFADQGGVSLKKLSRSEIPEMQVEDASADSDREGSRELFRTALLRQIPECKRLPSHFVVAGSKIARERWCEGTARWFLKELDAGLGLKEIFAKARLQLDWYRSTGKPDTGEVQFTGYFFPVHRAKETPDAVYRYPVYAAPSDLRKPYFTRAQIEGEGVLRGRGLELGYLDNPVDPFILQVQGSGALLFEDGQGGVTRRIVNYSNENGRPYTSLGRKMREAGIPEEFINLQGIRKYFVELHPEQWTQFAYQNESFVFFKQEDKGPYGSSGAILTPLHSVAVDPRQFPLGMVGLIRTERPDAVEGDQALSWKSFARFVVAQDTGGAILGPGRVDVFWGEGQYAEVAAGRTDRTGELYFMVVPAKKR